MNRIKSIMSYLASSAIVVSAILVSISLTACSTNKVPAVVRVEVPVPVPCSIKAPDVPDYAVDALPIGADIWDKMAALRADRVTRKAYEEELEAAIKSCQ